MSAFSSNLVFPRIVRVSLAGVALVILLTLSAGRTSAAQEAQDLSAGQVDLTTDCGEVAGIEVQRDLPGLEQFSHVPGIPVCEAVGVVSQGKAAVSGFTYNGTEVDPRSIPIAQGTSSVDSDLDGMPDERELEYGLDPNNGFDFLDHIRDCVIDVKDAQAIAFRWGVEKGSPIYSYYYDRESVDFDGDGDGDIAPGDGKIDISDLQMVFGQFGMTCGSGGQLWPNAQAVCNELAVEAAGEGVDDFTCSTNPLPSHVNVLDADRRYEVVQVRVWSSSAVEINSISAEVEAIPGQPAGEQPAGAPDGEIASYHTPVCETVICSFNADGSWKWRIFGLTCAEYSFHQTYKIYYPWRVVIDVTPPIAGATSSAPCDHSNISMDWDQSDLPFSSSLIGGVQVEAGVPFFGSLLTLRRWDFSVYFFIDGYFNTETQITS